ncbi:hypothetical protein [Saccharothrix sp. ST-888]|uniref:hypothetical protein n=1 Tax=Saccharothrix sp. ST-888 TaxID=1427391 RepID=UPI0005EBFC9D|nr:hypothetical protein [Saccharothrix sp. ST-888]KJK55415.1 hypothetical protein UK12_28760 [Saccharothrix sp. ST-888]
MATDGSPAEEDPGPERADAEDEPEPSEPSDSPADDGLPPEGAAADRLGSVQHQFVMQVFNGTVDARGGVFGHGAPGGRQDGDGRPRRRAAETGKLTDEELHEAIHGYARPACYESALAQLEKHHVVELWGPAGLGRRTGGIALLAEVVEGPVLLLQPTVTLKELASREYGRGSGYVVPGRVADATSAEDADHLWRRLRSTLRAAGAYLVVTTAVQAAGPPWRVVWERPEPRRLLLGALGGAEVSEEAVEEVLAGVPEDFRPHDLAEVARRLAAGASPQDALEQFELSASAAVAEWFRSGPEPRRVLEVTALAFTAGAGVRAYEDGLAKLEARMASCVPSLALPAEADPEEAVLPRLPANREALVSADGLICTRRVPDGVRTRTVVAFRDPVHRERVLAELCDRFDSAFWNGVGGWLAATVRAGLNEDPQLQLAVASGLALLARLDVQEVERTYLQPWSAGRLGWAGQQTAVFTVWLMCLADDGLAPVALSVAEGWANDPGRARRWAAAVAFTGELGLRYPHQATKQLWAMLSGDIRLREPAQQALAKLFGILASAGDKASVITGWLERQLVSSDGRPPGQRPSPVLLETLLALVSTPDERTGGPAVMSYLHESPDKTPQIARLWAAVICYRPLRRRALTALLTGLEELELISEDAAAEAGRLGEALARALPLPERKPFTTDLAKLVANSNRRPEADVLTEVLLAAVDRAHRRTATES